MASRELRSNDPETLEPLAAACFVVTKGGANFAIVVATLTLSMAESEDSMALIEPVAIVRHNLHHRSSPVRSLRAASDLVPYRPAADVLAIGHAHSLDGPALELPVRLTLLDAPGGATLIDKPLLVRPGEPVERFGLTYEQALRHVDNPYGADPKQARILDVNDPSSPAGFGPIAPTSASRARLLDADTRAGLHEIPQRLSDDVDWRYFHVAPPDQRVRFLSGREVVILEGMHPAARRIERRLPGLAAVARVAGAEAPLTLRADTLRIDATGMRCTLVFRGNFELPGPTVPPITLAIEGPGHPPRWPAAPPVDAAWAPKLELKSTLA